MKDKLVSPANTHLARRQLNGDLAEIIELAEQDHLLLKICREDVVFWAQCLQQKIKTGYKLCGCKP